MPTSITAGIQQAAPLAEIFAARSAAVIGASRDPNKAGYQVLKKLLSAGYDGRIYPVNPREREILGVSCYSSILEIKAPLELLIVSVPAAQVVRVMLEAEKCGGIKAAVVLSAGFSETGLAEGIEAERKLVEIARRSGLRIFGPNCIGIIDTGSRLCTGFAPGISLASGRIGFISQSGAFGAATLMLCADQPKPLGFSKFAHVGNMCDVSNLELLEMYDADPSIDVIAMYMEGVRDGRKLLNLASKITARKPIVLLKVGRTNGGAAATASHTGTLSGADAVYDAAFRQSGIVRVDGMAELVDGVKAISMLRKPGGTRVCVLTEAGGPGIACLDEMETGGTLLRASLAATSQRRLRQILPPMAVVAKPDGYVDMTGSALVKEHCDALEIVLSDPNVDSVILISLPPTFLPAVDLAAALVGVIRRFKKPVLACLMRGEPMHSARQHLEEHGVPTFDTPDGAARALRALTRASLAHGSAVDELRDGSPHPLIEGAVRQGRHLLEPEALHLLCDNGVETPPFLFAHDREEAIAAGALWGVPVVLKVVSPQVIHKSDVGGVRINLAGEQAVGNAYDQLIASVRCAVPEAEIAGVLVVPCAREGTEMIVGMFRDPQFGPVVLCGLGGIYVEVLRDVSFRVAPFDQATALEMIKETRASRILQGIRGTRPGDVEALAQLLVRVSEIGARYKHIREIDLNPVRVYENGIGILDARILLAKDGADES
jgi:acetyltransferase